MRHQSKLPEQSKSYIAIILPNKVKDTKFKPIPIEYIYGDSKEEICLINETLKIDSTGITTEEIIDDFTNKFLDNWKRFQKNEPVKNYLYINSPDIHPDEYLELKRKYDELVEK
jgi:hypothetical protein